jgi:CHAT domain-containing protein
MASPKSETLPPLPFANIERELQRLERDPNIIVVPVGRPTLINLELTARPASVFHFAGHGQFERSAGSIEAGLSFETDKGTEHFVSAENVAKEVRRLGVGVAILTACYGASRSATSPAAGISAALTRAGVTTVIAFASPIDDLVAGDALHELVDTIMERGALDSAITDFARSVDGQAW